MLLQTWHHMLLQTWQQMLVLTWHHMLLLTKHAVSDLACQANEPPCMYMQSQGKYMVHTSTSATGNRNQAMACFSGDMPRT